MGGGVSAPFDGEIDNFDFRKSFSMYRNSKKLRKKKVLIGIIRIKMFFKSNSVDIIAAVVFIGITLHISISNENSH